MVSCELFTECLHVNNQIDSITVNEIQETIPKKKNGKAVGPSSWCVEVQKFMGKGDLQYLKHLFDRIIEEDRIPNESGKTTLTRDAHTNIQEQVGYPEL